MFSQNVILDVSGLTGIELQYRSLGSPVPRIMDGTGFSPESLKSFLS